MTHYVGILDGKGKAYGVRLPDLAGCYGAGKTPEAAIEDVIGAAREWLAHQASKGVALPKPRSLADISKADEFDAGAGEIAVMVPVILDKGRTVRANLTFEAGLLEAIDAEAVRRGLTRSAFLASAAREQLESAE